MEVLALRFSSSFLRFSSFFLRFSSSLWAAILCTASTKGSTLGRVTYDLRRLRVIGDSGGVVCASPDILRSTSSQRQRGTEGGNPGAGGGRRPSVTHSSQSSGLMESSAAPLSRSTYAGMLVEGTAGMLAEGTGGVGLTNFFLRHFIELSLNWEENRPPRMLVGNSDSRTLGRTVVRFGRARRSDG
jgi:hypothetical protein